MRNLYFDSAATGIPSQAARDGFLEAYEKYGNPSSIHREGMAAAELLINARKTIADSFGVSDSEIYFNGCGSEGNNTVIYSVAKANERFSKRIVTDDSEHPSVLVPLEKLENEGFEVIRIGTKGGKLDLDALEKALSVPTSLAVFMQVNNETGAHYDLASVRRMIDASGNKTHFHCDAVQGYMKVGDKYEIRKYCDTASVSAHKIGGFKGTGALYVKKGIRINPLILGGGQEKGLRSGTENIPGINAFACAVKAFPKGEVERIKGLRDFTAGRLKELLGDRAVFRIPERSSGAILSLSVLGVRSETMLNALSSEGICISAGSACSSKSKGSHVLTAYGVTDKEMESAVRISFCAYNTEKDCEFLCEKIAETAKRIVK